MGNVKSTTQSLSSPKIIRSVYSPSEKSLFIRFESNIVAGYDTKEYVDVDIETAKEYKDAEDKTSFYLEHIKGNFKFRYVYWDSILMLSFKDWKPTKPLRTYADYVAEFNRIQQQKDAAAFNSLK